ncbi:MAG: DUF2232 domain-containing protein [Roseitalea porphyridii]|uniref:DUF2232 domain-containing protein n=1 Tax=Roseitalea porphyridii TaxID=1852022 RepID=UPI0032D94684
MNVNMIGIGLIAGSATALLCLGVVAGSGLSVILYFLSAVPLMVATLGWGFVAGVTGAIVAAVAIAAFANLQLAIYIVMTTILPATAAGYWMNLARPADEIGGPAGQLAWYPLSDVIVRLAIITAGAFIVAGFLIGYGPALVEELVGEMIARLQEANPEFAFSPEGRESFMGFMTGAIPFMQPALWLMVLVGSLYLALGITRASGRLTRPRDDWPTALRLPRSGAIILAVAIAISFFSGPIGLAATAIAGALVSGFTLAGFAVFHERTRGAPWRPLAMITVYGAVLITLIAALPFFFVGLFATSRPMPVSPGGGASPPSGTPPAST